MGVDSIIDKDTFFYKNEQQIQINRQSEKFYINEKNQLGISNIAIDKYKSTNPFVEFHNPLFKPIINEGRS